jgi:hypothetical protein
MIKRLMQGAGAMHPSEWHLIISKRSITFLCVSLFALRKEYLPPNITIRESRYDTNQSSQRQNARLVGSSNPILGIAGSGK